jgi:hypothetical protein
MSTTQQRERFEALAQRAEADFDNNPQAYQRKLKWLALLGYGYLFFILTLCVGSIGVMAFLTINTSWFWVLLIKKEAHHCRRHCNVCDF